MKTIPTSVKSQGVSELSSFNTRRCQKKNVFFPQHPSKKNRKFPQIPWISTNPPFLFFLVWPKWLVPWPCVTGTFKRELRDATPSSEELPPKKDRGTEELGVSETSPVQQRVGGSDKSTIFLEFWVVESSPHKYS